MTPPQVRADDNRFSFISMGISIAGREWLEIVAMAYADTLNRSFVYGTSPYALGRTRGTYAAGGSFSILKERHQELLDFLGPGWASKEFDIIVSYSEGDAPMITDQLERCAFANGKDAWKYGPDPLYVDADFSAIKIWRNGIPPY